MDMKPSIPCAFPLLVLAAISGPDVTAAESSPEQAEREIREMEAKFEQAVVKGDLEFFKSVLASDFTHTTQTGKVRDRAEWLANHRPSQSNYDALNVSELAVRLYGDTAVVTAAIKPIERKRPVAADMIVDQRNLRSRGSVRSQDKRRSSSPALWPENVGGCAIALFAIIGRS